MRTTRPDGTVFNTVHHVVVNDNVTVSDLIGQPSPAKDGTVVILRLADWQPGQPIPPTPILVIEADCNRGKSHAVHAGMIRPMLLANPHLPMLHVSVRVTHAYDLYETVKKHYVTAAGQPIPGFKPVLYKEGDDGVKERCQEATQLVISPEQISFGNLGDPSRFRGGVLVLDEAVSFALSLGKDSHGTIGNPQYVVDQLQHLASIMPHVIVMDRDMTLNSVGSKLLPCIAPDRDVNHFQLTQPGQRNALCYTFNTKKHTVAGRGTPLAMKRLLLHLDECKRSFEGTPDDDTRMGPPQWRRMLIAVASKKLGEREVLPLLKRMGFTPDQYLFYHGDIPEAEKRALRDTNKAWRNVIVIVATTTIEVAINIEHKFLARWLFTSSHGQFVSLSSELMQLLARVPRGVDPVARADQLTDHRIHVLFDGNEPTVARPTGPSDAARQATLKRTFDQRGVQLLGEERQAVQARLTTTGVPSAEPAPSGGDALNSLRAAVQGYRNDHDGQVHVRRFFEIAAKNGFEAPEEMAVLTPQEEANVVAIQTGLPDAVAIMEAEAQALFPDGGEEEASSRALEKYVNDHPTDLKSRFILLLRYLEHLIVQHNLANPDYLLTMDGVRDSFLTDCFGLHPNGVGKDNSSLEKLQLSIFYSLRDFILDPDQAQDNLTWIENRADDADDAGDGDDARVTSAGVYMAIIKLQAGAKRLARLRVYSLAEIRTNDMEKSERMYAKNRETVAPEGFIMSKYHDLFGLLFNFQALRPQATGAPIELAHGLSMQDGTLVQQAEHPCTWLQAHNRLVLDAYGTDVEQKRLDVHLMTKVKSVVFEMPGVNKGQWAQISLVTTFERAMALLGLRCDQEEVYRQRKKLIAKIEVREISIDDDILACSLADAVRIYVPGDGDQRYVRADKFTETITRMHNERRMQRRDQGLSDSDYESPDRPQLPTPMATGNLILAFDPLRRWEAIDSIKLKTTLINALDDQGERKQTIDAIDARVHTLQGQNTTPAITTELTQLDGWLKALCKMVDMEAMLTTMDSHFGDEETAQKRWLQVPYEKAPLGRTYARAQVVTTRLFDGADDPAQKAQVRSLGYQGMFGELRPRLGGRFLHDIDMKKAFANLVVNIARRKG